MKQISLMLPTTYIEALDSLVEQKMYATRAEAIRMAIRDLIKTEELGREDEN